MNSVPEQDNIPFDPRKCIYDTHVQLVVILKQNGLHLANQQIQNCVQQRQRHNDLDVTVMKTTVHLINQDVAV
eukprot:2294988-Ditylum_brightwellii.AAC.1